MNSFFNEYKSRGIYILYVLLWLVLLIIKLIEFTTAIDIQYGVHSMKYSAGKMAGYCMYFTQPQRGGTAIACPVIEPTSHGATAPGGPMTGPALYQGPRTFAIRYVFCLEKILCVVVTLVPERTPKSWSYCLRTPLG